MRQTEAMFMKKSKLQSYTCTCPQIGTMYQILHAWSEIGIMFKSYSHNDKLMGITFGNVPIKIYKHLAPILTRLLDGLASFKATLNGALVELMLWQGYSNPHTT